MTPPQPGSNQPFVSSAVEPTFFPNLRSRPSIQTWEVEAKGVTALVREVEAQRTRLGCVSAIPDTFWTPLKNMGIPPDPSCDPRPRGTRITLEIALEVPSGARLIGVKTTHPEDKLERQEETDAGKKARWKLEFFAPEMDLKIHNRDPVILRVEYEFEGRRRAEDVAVDYRFLMGYQSGDPAKGISYLTEAAKLADIVKRHGQDAPIQKLLRRAGVFKKGSVQEETARLKDLLGFESRKYYVNDPTVDVHGVDYYVLSPAETLRYGGDCEDLAILAGAYFSGRGYRAEIVIGLGHAWTIVEGETVDLTKETDTEGHSRIVSSALVSSEHTAPRAQPKP